MSGESETISFRIDDRPELESILEDVEDKSGFIRDAIRDAGREKMARYADLPDRQAAAYQWLVDNAAGETIARDTATSLLAQQLSLNAELIDKRILRPLDSKGYIHYAQGYFDAAITVRHPTEVSGDD